MAHAETSNLTDIPTSDTKALVTMEKPPPCEDHFADVPARPAASYVERTVLGSHGLFRRAILRGVAIYGAAPIVLYALVSLVRLAFPGPFAAWSLSGALLLALGALAAVSVMSVVWTNLVFRVDQRFARIRRQSDFAAESINVDDESHVAAAVETLDRTWMYRVVLLRWLRDLRMSFLVLVAFAALIAALVATNVPGLLELMPTVEAGVWAAVITLDVLAVTALSTRLIVKAAGGGHLDPTEPVTERINTLLGEVKDLRRGRFA